MRVLLLRLSSLGDVILATAAAEAVATRAAGARVHVATRAAFADVFRGHPAVERVLAWDPATGFRGLAGLVEEGRYDRVVDLQGSPRTRALALAVRGPRWSRIRRAGLRRRVAVLLRRPELLPSKHVLERYADALGSQGDGAAGLRPRVVPSAEDRARAAVLLEEGGGAGAAPVVALAPGARWAAKAWPAAHWGALVEELAASGAVRTVLLGGGGDRALCEAVGGRAPSGAMNLAGRTSLLETAAVLERCRALVTNDSAPMHLSGAVGTPVVALFGPTVPALGFGPLGVRDVVLERSLPCRPCSLHGGRSCRRGHHACLSDLRPSEVLAALWRLPGLEAAGRGREAGCPEEGR